MILLDLLKKEVYHSMKDKRSFQGPSCHLEYFGSLHRFCCTPIPSLLTPMACDGETKCELSIPFLFSESAGAHDCAQTASAWGQPHSLPPPRHKQRVHQLYILGLHIIYCTSGPLKASHET